MADPGADARLQEIEARYEAISDEMSSPEVANDQDRMRDLGRSFSELQEIVVAVPRISGGVSPGRGGRQMESAESEPEMAAYFRDEADRAEARARSSASASTRC